MRGGLRLTPSGRGDKLWEEAAAVMVLLARYRAAATAARYRIPDHLPRKAQPRGRREITRKQRH